MNSESVDLIATDPPFNKGRDFHATPDSLAAGASFQDRWSWDDDVHQDWVDRIIDQYPKLWGAIEAARFTHSDGMGAFICFLSVRALAMHRILKPTGSIYLHCDPTANSYIRLMLDAIFGADNMRNEIVWAYSGPASPKIRQFNRKHDTILWYSKGKDWVFNKDAVRIPYKDPNQKPRKAFDTGGHFDDESIKKMRENGKVPFSWWDGIGIACRSSKENTGYPTQKPLALMHRIIKASCPEGGIVFDPFAGCATTCVAAEQLRRQWVGADLWEGTKRVTKERLLKEVSGFADYISTKMTSINVITTPPKRTDRGNKAAPNMKTPTLTLKTKEPSLSRADMIEALLDRDGPECQGCDFVPPHTRYFEIDHKLPRADGGTNDLDNRCLLCGPCNRTKSNTLTLSGLRLRNKQDGVMVK